VPRSRSAARSTANGDAKHHKAAAGERLLADIALPGAGVLRMADGSEIGCDRTNRGESTLDAASDKTRAAGDLTMAPKRRSSENPLWPG
jgi:hypothetical protein